MRKQVTIGIIILVLISISSCTTRIETPDMVEAPVLQRGLFRVNPTINTSNSPQLALVIGNSQYEYKPLRNPINDAKDMARVLRKIGFEVTVKTNLNQRSMGKYIREFTQKLSQHQIAVGLFYFSGHGAQANGENFLIPIDNRKIQDQYDLESYAVHADKLVKRMQDATNHVNIIILDACRDNPYRSVGKNTSRGLARMPVAGGSFIAYATAVGKTASDVSSGGRNGLYTKHLLDALESAPQTHPRIEDLFIEVSNAATQESGGQQEPWYNSSLKGKFCFGGCKRVTIPSSSLGTRPKNAQLPICESHFKAGRLSDALACYRDGLKSEHTNVQALAGLDKIEARYMELIQKALKKRQLMEAQQYLASLRRLSPASSQLSQLEEEFKLIENQILLEQRQEGNDAVKTGKRRIYGVF